MPLLHLPIQSGSSRILKNMNRNHTINEYLNIIEILKDKKKNIKFSSDFIIGYPGETNNDFLKTLELLKKVKFINSYSFIFSPRPGTPASNLEKIDKEISKKRLKIFQQTANRIKTDYRNKLINSIVTVLFENETKNRNNYFGRDEHFNSVIVNSDTDLSGKLVKVRVNECNQNTLFGELISNNEYKECAA